MKYSRLLAAFGSTACLLSATPSLAAVFTTTYDAVVEGGYDTENLFGFDGGDLTDQVMSIAVTYDTSIPGTRTTDVAAGTDEITGGIDFGTDPVITSAVFTVLGSPGPGFSFTPDYYGDVYTSPDYLDAYGYDLLGDDFQANFIPDGYGPTNLEYSFEGPGDGDESGVESFLTSGSETVVFDPVYVFAGIAPAPEPTTWALMVSGLAVIGLGLRWSRRRGGYTADASTVA